MDFVHDTRLYIQLLHLLNHCPETSNKTNSKCTLATLFNLSKAFDVISHKSLLQKVNNYGIRGIANKCLKITAPIEPNMLNLAILSLL